MSSIFSDPLLFQVSFLLPLPRSLSDFPVLAARYEHDDDGDHDQD